MRQLYGWVGLCLCLCAPSAWSAAVYHLGNSLTWDAQPDAIKALALQEGRTHTSAYHIRSNASLTQIAQSDANDFVSSAGIYRNALPNNDWDAVTMQAYGAAGSTIQSEADAMAALIRLTQSQSKNDDTIFYLYTGFGNPQTVYTWDDAVVESNGASVGIQDQTMRYIYDRVVAQTDADVRLIPMGEVMFRLATAADAGEIAGISSRYGLYRDPIHASHLGRYAVALTHYATIYNDVLEGIGPSPAFYGWLNPDATATINGIVWDVVSNDPLTGVPEPGGLVALAGLAGGLLGRRPSSRPTFGA